MRGPQLPLFDLPEPPAQRRDAPYPHSPGFKERGDTSQAAAATVRPGTRALRAACLAQLRSRPQTADEVAAALGESVLAVRPRISELKALGKIVKLEGPFGRRLNASGIKAAVWRVTV